VRILLLDAVGWGAKGPAQPWFVDEINRRSGGREESRGRAETVRKAVRHFQTGGLERLSEGAGNKGAPGVDGCSIEYFEKDLKGNLYKIWSASSRTGSEAFVLV
jgi:hypothetical protein